MTALKTTCPYCGVGCGVSIPEYGNRSIRVSGDDHHTANQGRLCVKGTHLGDTLPLKQRLLRPKVKGETVAWSTALDRISSALDSAITQHGSDSVAFYLSGQMLTEDYYVANKLAKGFLGTANVDTNSRLCMSSAVAAYTRAFGEDAVPGCYEDLELADLVVLIGSNLAWAHPVLFQRLQAARQADPNKKLVVIDPRVTETTEAADLHLALNPGSDGLLLNGLLCWLADHGRLDQNFIEAHTEGFADSLASARAQAGQPIAELAQACGLDEADLRQFYAWFSATPRTVTAWSMGINQSRSGVDKSQAIINLHLATGRIGKAGATPFSITGQPNAMGGREVGGLANQLASHMDFSPNHVERVGRFWKAQTMATAPGLKAVELFEAAAQGNIKVLWIMATNPLASLPDAKRVREALEKVETVIVSDVVTDNDTLAFADILLPALAWGEKDGTVTNSERTLSRQRSFLLPPGEAQPDWWAMAEVAKRMGFGDAFTYQNSSDVFREHAGLSTFEADPWRQFNLAGLDQLSTRQYDELKPLQWPIRNGKGSARLFTDHRFATPSGRARFVAVQPALPDETGQSLRLNTGRLRDQWHSMTRTGLVPGLTEHRQEFCISLHPDDARRLNIEAGQLCRIHNDRGSFAALADVTDRQQPGQCFAAMHWNRHHASDGGVGRCIPPITDPISGQPESKHASVRVNPVTVKTYGLLIADQVPPTLLEGAIWFRTKLNQLSLWQLYFPEHSVAQLTEDWPEAADLTLADTEGHWYYRIQPKAEEPLWLALSSQPLVRPDALWLENNLLEARPRLDDWIRGSESGQPSNGQLICTCTGVRDTDIEAFLQRQPGSSVAQVQATLGCSTVCGSCHSEVCQLVGKAESAMELG